MQLWQPVQPTFCFCQECYSPPLVLILSLIFSKEEMWPPFNTFQTPPFSEGGRQSPTDYVQQQTLQGYIVVGNGRGFAPSFCSNIRNHSKKISASIWERPPAAISEMISPIHRNQAFRDITYNMLPSAFLSTKYSTCLALAY